MDMSVKIEPRNKWLVIEPVDEPSMVRGLYIPGNVNEAYKMAKVVAVPPDVDMQVEAGQIVIYDSLGTVPMRFEGGVVNFVKSVNVLGVVSKPA